MSCRVNVFLIGYPGDVGGACTESWHAVKLWRRFGLSVTAVPTWKADPVWRDRLAAIGVETLDLPASGGPLLAAAGCPLSIAVAFCNQPFLDLAMAGRLCGCRTVWAPCMMYLTDAERRALAAGVVFDRYIFQSKAQQDMLGPELEKLGVPVERFRRVPGWLDIDEFPFRPRPHRPHEPFVVGRLSRSDPRKFSPATWAIYTGIAAALGTGRESEARGLGVRSRSCSSPAPRPSPPAPHFHARIMGWSPIIERKIGRPPGWAEVLEKGAEPATEFLGSLHAVVHAGGEAVENWPRFVLEATAAGVPVVTDARGGTVEMIRSDISGILCHTEKDFILACRQLAGDETRRLGIAAMARRTVEAMCDPVAAWERWREVLTG